MLSPLTRSLAQAYAPLEPPTGPPLPERFLYLLACLAPACRAAPGGSWRLLRAQLGAEAVGRPAGQTVPAVPPSAPPAALDWGTEAAWGEGETAAPDALSLAALGAALEAAQVAGRAADAAPRERSRRDGGAAPAVEEPGGVALPSFYLAAVDEPEAGGRDAQGDRAAALAAQYAAAEGTLSEAGGGEEAWVGEEYEGPTVRGVDRTGLKFSKRLARCPSQCARYGCGAPPLWPSARRPPALPCARCGGGRVVEGQLMAPLLAFLGEGVTEGHPLAPALADWDWATVALLTCAAGCGGGGYSEEAAWADAGEEAERLRSLLAER